MFIEQLLTMLIIGGTIVGLMTIIAYFISNIVISLRPKQIKGVKHDYAK